MMFTRTLQLPLGNAYCMQKCQKQPIAARLAGFWECVVNLEHFFAAASVLIESSEVWHALSFWRKKTASCHQYSKKPCPFNIPVFLNEVLAAAACTRPWFLAFIPQILSPSYDPNLAGGEFFTHYVNSWKALSTHRDIVIVNAWRDLMIGRVIIW